MITRKKNINNPCPLRTSVVLDIVWPKTFFRLSPFVFLKNKESHRTIWEWVNADYSLNYPLKTLLAILVSWGYGEKSCLWQWRPKDLWNIKVKQIHKWMSTSFPSPLSFSQVKHKQVSSDTTWKTWWASAPLLPTA